MALAGTAALLASTLVPFSSANASTQGITEYSVPSSLPLGGVCEIEFDHTGKLWIEQYVSSEITSFDEQTKQFKSYATPSPLSVPGGMDVDDDGNLWFPGVVSNSLIRLDPTDGSMTQIPLPWQNVFNADVLGVPFRAGTVVSNDVTWGADNAVWFTAGGKNGMGRYDPATGQFSFYKMPDEVLGQAQAVFGITKPGPGRTVLMSAGQVNKVYSIDVDTKKITTYTMPTPNSFPVGIRADSKGNIWVSEALGMKIAKIDPDTGKITEYPLYGLNGILNSVLDGLLSGSIGNPLPTPGPLAEGSDGNIYVAVAFPLAASLGNQIARFNPQTHAVKLWQTPSSASYPCDINVHQPGSVWFGELSAQKIGRLDIG